MLTTTSKCWKCGRPVVKGVSLCGVCNPAGLKQPSPSQAHGMLYGVLGLMIVVLFVTIPFLYDPGSDTTRLDSVVTGFTTATDPLTATVSVRNGGPKPVVAACRLRSISQSGAVITSAMVKSPRPIQPGEDLVFPARLSNANADTPVRVDADCAIDVGA